MNLRCCYGQILRCLIPGFLILTGNPVGYSRPHTLPGKPLEAAAATTVQPALPPAVTAKKDPSKLRIVVEADAYPLSYHEPDGKLSGFDIAFGTLVAQQLKRAPDISVKGSGTVLAALKSGAGDMVLAGIMAYGDRDPQLTYLTYSARPQTYLSRGKAITATKDLKGLQIGVLSASKARLDLAQAQSDGLGLKRIRGYYSSEAMIKDLKQGIIDAAVVDSEWGQGLALKSQGTLKPSILSAGWEPLAVVLRTTDSALIKKVTTAITQLQQQGTLSKLQQQWFGATGP